jgi:hypothetical protein
VSFPTAAISSGVGGAIGSGPGFVINMNVMVFYFSFYIRVERSLREIDIKPNIF